MNKRLNLCRALAFSVVLLLLTHFAFELPEASAQSNPATSVVSINWSPDGSRIASGNANGLIYIQDALTGQILKTLAGHSGPVFDVAWNPDGSKLASVGADKTVRIWDTTSGQLLFTLTGHLDITVSVIWSADGSKIFSGSTDEPDTLRVWNAINGTLIGAFPSGIVIDMAVSPDGTRLATANPAGGVGIIDTATFQALSFMANPELGGQGYDVQTVAWSPDGTRIGSGSLNGGVRLWDVATGSILATWRGNDSQQIDYRISAIERVVFSPNGSDLFSVSANGTLRGWDVTSGQVIVNTQISAPSYAAAWSPDGTKLAYGGTGTTVQVIPAPSPLLTGYGNENQDSDVALRQTTSYTADQCTGGTANASSHTVGNYPANAFDNNNSTNWQSSSTVPQWIEYNFGSGASRTIRRYAMRSAGSGGAGAPTNFTLQYYDGSAWQTADSRSGVSWSANQTKTFGVAADHTATRWRLHITNAQAQPQVIIAEIEMDELATVNHEALAQSFHVSGAATVGHVSLWLDKIGVPAGNLTLSIRMNSVLNTPGFDVSNGTSGTVAASTLGTSYGWVDFTFATPPSLSAGTTYWLVLTTTDAASGTNYVQWGADGSAPGYAEGEMLSQTGGVWSAEGKDAVFEVWP